MWYYVSVFFNMITRWGNHAFISSFLLLQVKARFEKYNGVPRHVYEVDDAVNMVEVERALNDIEWPDLIRMLNMTTDNNKISHRLVMIDIPRQLDCMRIEFLFFENHFFHYL